jgi:hypothetical protein
MTVTGPEDIATWAAEQAAALPPFTPDEAAEAGRLAAMLDARPATGQDSPDDQQAAS